MSTTAYNRNSLIFQHRLQDVCSCHRPHEWKSQRNPAYWWQLYYLWANLEVLNNLRRARGLNTIAFRPHAGETGDPMHLACTYMLCESINHGVNLDMQVSLQYLYYLDQVSFSFFGCTSIVCVSFLTTAYFVGWTFDQSSVEQFSFSEDCRKSVFQVLAPWIECYSLHR